MWASFSFYLSEPVTLTHKALVVGKNCGEIFFHMGRLWRLSKLFFNSPFSFRLSTRFTHRPSTGWNIGFSINVHQCVFAANNSMLFSRAQRTQLKFVFRNVYSECLIWCYKFRLNWFVCHVSISGMEMKKTQPWLKKKTTQTIGAFRCCFGAGLLQEKIEIWWLCSHSLCRRGS